MRIGIDISTVLNHGQDIGAGRYIINLVRNLLKIDKKNTYILTGRYVTDKYLEIINKIKSTYTDNKIEFKLYKTTQRNLDIWNRLKFPPIELMGFKADLLHCPDYLIPATLNKTIILTIHDLAFIRFPQFNFDWFIKKYTKEVKRNTALAKVIIADSKSTKNDTIKFFKIDPPKVKVVYLASDSRFKKLAYQKRDKKVLIKYGIDKKYILSTGTIEPRKNYSALIKAFNYIKHNNNNFDFKLVIVGRTGWKSESTYKERELSPYKDDILFTGRVSDKELVQIYNQAEIFVYPSLFEGFGLPPIEAMSCGLPVIASDSSSLKEVVGNAGILIPPDDFKKISNQILYILKNEKIAEKLKEKSLEQAKKFRWEKTARETLKIYEEIMF
jgi:glycosyltransferase involved in cell wall biosynthesis